MKDFDAQEDAFQDLAGALAKNGQINEALTVATQQNIHSSIGRAYALTPIIQELARIGDTERALTIAAEIETDLGEKAKCLIAVTEYFMGHAQTAKALDVVGKVKDEPSVHARVLRSIVKHLARAGLPDQARNLLSEFETTEKAEKSLATSAVAIAYRKSGRANEADTSLTEAIRLADDLPRSDVHRDIALMPICDAYADGGRYREARLVAERMREEWRQSYVYRNILSAYAGKKNPKFGISVETLLENSPDEP
jgi:tetratricopeptide (TPR) repeat protein